MHADHLVGALRDRGDLGNRDRGGVGGQHGAFPDDAVQLSEDVQFKRLVFGDRLDGEIDACQIGHVLSGLDAAKGLADQRLGNGALLGLPLQVLADGLHRLFQLGSNNVEEHYLIPVLREHVGNAVAHLSRAKNADCRDHHCLLRSRLDSDRIMQLQKYDLIRHIGDFFAAVHSDGPGVFDADGALAGQHKLRFDGDRLAGLERRGIPAQGPATHPIPGRPHALRTWPVRPASP